MTKEQTLKKLEQIVDGISQNEYKLLIEYIVKEFSPEVQE